MYSEHIALLRDGARALNPEFRTCLRVKTIACVRLSEKYDKN